MREGNATEPLGLLTRDFQIALRLSEENPEDFGYPYQFNGRIRLPLVSEKAQGFAKASSPASKSDLVALRAGSPPPGMLKRVALTDEDVAAFERFEKVSGGKTFTQSMTDKDTALDLATQEEFKDLQASMSYVDTSSGRVILVVERNSAALSAALAKEIGSDGVEIRLEKRPDAAPVSRDADWSAFGGGARIFTSGLLCSDAFSWHYGSTPMMLSAGHCAPKGAGSVSTPVQSMGHINGATDENWDAGVGTVKINGQTVYRGDLSLITASSPTTSVIYRGGATSNTVSHVSGMPVGRSVYGMTVCTGGEASGEICVWTVTGNLVNVDYGNGVMARNVTTTALRWDGKCVIPGDSGGSVFAVNANGTVNAHGIISGNTYVGPGCSVVFTDIYDAYYGLPGSLSTG